MECFIYCGQVGCEFDSEATAAWIQAIGTLVAVGGAAIFPYWHQKKKVAFEKREQAKRVLELVDLAYGPICTFVGNLGNEDFDVFAFFRATFNFKDLEFVADRLDELRSIDCPSSDLIQPLHNFRTSLREFHRKLTCRDHHAFSSAKDMRLAVLQDLAPSIKLLNSSYSEIIVEPNKY